MLIESLESKKAVYEETGQPGEIFKIKSKFENSQKSEIF